MKVRACGICKAFSLYFVFKELFYLLILICLSVNCFDYLFEKVQIDRHLMEIKKWHFKIKYSYIYDSTFVQK